MKAQNKRLFSSPIIAVLYVNPLKTEIPKVDTLINSEDPDEMPHNAAFHLGLHCLLRQNQSPEKEIYFL